VTDYGATPGGTRTRRLPTIRAVKAGSARGHATLWVNRVMENLPPGLSSVIVVAV
jgi:hypothetical protein